MSNKRFITLDLNPEPWAVGSLGIAKKAGPGRGQFPYMAPNKQLVAFQNAVKEELSGIEPLDYDEIQLEFYFWRCLDQYRGPSGRVITKKAADATNLQKSLEDALQGVLFKNDRNVRKITSEIVEQGIDVKPSILVVASKYGPAFPESNAQIISEENSTYEQPTLPFGVNEEIF